MQQFTPEFRRDAVALVRSSGRPIAHIARELGVDDATLGNWVRDDRRNGKLTVTVQVPPYASSIDGGESLGANAQAHLRRA
jgi:transposase-like protein